MCLASVELGQVVQVDHFAIDPSANQPRLANRANHVFVLSSTAAHQGRQKDQLCPFAQTGQRLLDLLDGLLDNRITALGAKRPPNTGEE